MMGLLLAIRFALVFSYSLDLDGAEFVFVHFTQLLAQGLDLYRDPNAFPFLSVMYFPCYFVLLRQIASLLHIDPVSDLHNFYVFARLISWVMMLCNLLIINKIIKLFTGDSLTRVVALLLYLLLISGHFYAVRPDSIKCLMISIFLYALLRCYFKQCQLKYIAAMIATAVIATAVKQDSILSLGIILIVALRFNAKFTIKLGLAIGGLIMLLCWFFYQVCGIYFFDNTILSNVQVVTDITGSFNLYVIIGSVLRLSPLLVLIVLGYRKSRSPIERYCYAVFGLSFVSSHLVLLRSGSYLNYTFDLILFATMLSVIAMSKVESSFALSKLKFPLVLGYLGSLLILDVLFNSYSYSHTKEIQNQSNYNKYQKNKEVLEKYINYAVVFFPDPKHTVFYPTQRLYYGYEANVDRFITLHTRLKIKSKNLFVNTRKADEYFKNGTVKYIVIEPESRYQKNIEEFYGNYTFEKAVGIFLVYKFNQNKKM